MKPPKELVELLEDSLRWSRDHKGAQYKNALPCERCLAMGLCHGIASYTGQTSVEVFKKHQMKINNEKIKRRVIKRPMKRKVIKRR